MAFEQCWRWFGPRDPISLDEVRQTGATGVVTALHQIPIGEIWPADDILARKAMIEAVGLRWSVTESLPVHEDIKRRTGRYRALIENYKVSVRNLGRAGIPTLCYNFMPVLDWSRTSLTAVVSDGSIASRFDAHIFAAFDLFILQRPGAEESYTVHERSAAERFYEGLTAEGRKTLMQTVLLGFPGSGEAYTLDTLREAIAGYREHDAASLRDHLADFVREIAPVAEEAGVLLAIHPDDPPWPLLGLPRVVSSAADVERILAAADTPSNGITLCTGSFGASRRNDLVSMARKFGPRINFVHLRNVTRTEQGDFLEAEHLGGDLDMYQIVKALLEEQQRRRREGSPHQVMPMRPDHGHLMIPDMGRQGIYPGYSLFGRMRGLAELRGLELGVRMAFNLEE